VTSQILNDLIGTKSLLVSTLSNRKLLSLSNSEWKVKNINASLGISVNNGMVAIVCDGVINIYDENGVNTCRDGGYQSVLNNLIYRIGLQN
jgi:hypothetical protein